MLMAASILATSSANAVELNRGQVSPEARNADNRRMLLRGTTETDTDDEDRGFISWLRLQFWLETGASKKDVRQALGLGTLEGAALKAAPNFIYYDDFLSALEGRILENWLKKGVTTKQLWKHYELPEDIPIAQLKDLDVYKTVVRFAKMEDDKMFNLRKIDDGVRMEHGGSPAEMETKLAIWVAARRPNYYVKDMLDLDKRSRRAFLNSEYYPYYDRFLELTGQKPAKPQIPSVEA